MAAAKNMKIIVQRYTENPAANWINFHGKTGTNRNQRSVPDGYPQGNLNHLVR